MEGGVPCGKRDGKMVRKVLVVAALGFSLVLAGCNTVKGLGRDIESVGKAGEKAI